MHGCLPSHLTFLDRHSSHALATRGPTRGPLKVDSGCCGGPTRFWYDCREPDASDGMSWSRCASSCIAVECPGNLHVTGFRSVYRLKLSEN